MRLANIVALFLLALMALGVILFGVLGVRAFVVPVRLYSPEDLAFVGGRVERVNVDSEGYFWIEGQNLPFAGVLSHETFNQIHEGDSVKVGCLRSEHDSPLRVFVTGHAPREVCTLEIEGRTVQSLDDFNRYNEQEALLGKFAAPILCLMGIGAFVCMLVGRNRLRQQSLAELLEPRVLRFRDHLGVGAVLGILVAPILGIQGWYGEGWFGQWAGPGVRGALLGTVSALAFGICAASVLGTLSVLFRWVGKWAKKSRTGEMALTAVMLVLTVLWLIVYWDGLRLHWLIILVLISGGVGVLFRRAALGAVSQGDDECDRP